MSLIPEKLNLKESYDYVDKMFNGWFSKHYITLESVKTYTFNIALTKYFKNLTKFTSFQVLVGMLWMYYNYPIDWVCFHDDTISDKTLIYENNLYKLVCFLRILKISDTEIEKNIYIISKYFFESPEYLSRLFIDIQYGLDPSHLFNDNTIKKLIADRENDEMFKDDTKLISSLNKKLANKMQAKLVSFAKDQEKLENEKERNRKILEKQAMITEQRTLKRRQLTEESNKTAFLPYTGELMY
jgi:hypothetical protein